MSDYMHLHHHLCHRKLPLLAIINVQLFVLLLAILYDHMIMYVGLFGHFAVVFRVFMFFSCFHVFYWLFVWLCFFSVTFYRSTQLYKLTYLLSYFQQLVADSASQQVEICLQTR